MRTTNGGRTWRSQTIGTTDDFLNGVACAFQTPPANTYGNVGRSVLYGPSTKNWDISLQRRFKLYEEKALAVKFDAAEHLRGSPASVTITAHRDPGFTEEIALAASGQPANVAPALKNIAKGQYEVKAQFTIAANTPRAIAIIHTTS